MKILFRILLMVTVGFSVFLECTEMEKQNQKFPYEIKELEPEAKAEVARLYQSPDIDFVSVGPKGYKLLRPYCEEAENIYNMPVRSSDIFVVSYQRSGTTWTQELVWLVANNLDYAGAARTTILEKYPFLDLFMLFSNNKKWSENLAKNVPNKATELAIENAMCTPVTAELLTAPSPRFIKTHLPMSLLPPKLLDTAKVVYVARDPRDVAVSSYHLQRLFRILEVPGPFKDFWHLFINDLFILTPLFEHVKEAWAMRHHPNMLFLFYEELKKDLPTVIRRVADFLDKDLTDEQVTRLCDHLSIENFKKNDSLNFENLREFDILAPKETFIRTGKAGGWRDYFDEEMTQQAEQWIADNLRDTDLRYPSFNSFSHGG